MERTSSVNNDFIVIGIVKSYKHKEQTFSRKMFAIRFNATSNIVVLQIGTPKS